jgi:hypothetical protein
MKKASSSVKLKNCFESVKYSNFLGSEKSLGSLKNVRHLHLDPPPAEPLNL